MQSKQTKAENTQPENTQPEKNSPEDESVAIETRTELVLKAVNETSHGPSLPHSVAECVEFVYEPLETTQFRVLKIHPGAKGAPLEADLVHASLTDAPQYQALSYTWGSLEPPFYMSCNGIEMRVTKSLYDALCNARKEDETLTIWADAVCINQKDVAEKSVQVALMREIYSKADSLFIWVGQPKDPDDATLVSDTFDHLAFMMTEKFGCSPKERLEFLKPSQWTVFFQFFLMPWFTRVWIYQEVTSIRKTAEKNITLAYGNAKLSWAKFAVVTRGLICFWLDIALDLAEVPRDKFPMKIIEMIELERTTQWINLQLPDETLSEEKLLEIIECAASTNLRPIIIAEYDMEAYRKIPNLEAEKSWLKNTTHGVSERCKSFGFRIPPIILKYRNFIRGRKTNGSASGRLFKHLDLSRRLSSTDARDKLFAFCGLLHDEIESESNQKLAPNYRKSVADVFIDLTLYFVQEELCLDIFELLPDQVEIPETLKIEGLPTWTVDLTQAPKAELMMPSASISTDGSNDRGLSSYALGVGVSADRRQLGLSVYALCQIQGLVPPAPETPIPYKEHLQSLREMPNFVQVEGEDIVNDPLVWAKEATYVSGGSVYEAFWRTAAGSALAWGPAGDEDSEFVWRTFFEGWHKRMWNTLHHSDDGSDADSICEKHPELSFEERHWQLEGSKPFSAHRQYCTTRRGFMGWVPQRARVRDTVCIIPGARMPYLIRPTEVGEHWELVGPAYIHGVMEGLFDSERNRTVLSPILPTLSTKGEELLSPDSVLNICLV
ncbi:heterokaryon incompatibility protein-domain-containing protein [Phyllosticta citribraziliensis]